MKLRDVLHALVDRLPHDWEHIGEMHRAIDDHLPDPAPAGGAGEGAQPSPTEGGA